MRFSPRLQAVVIALTAVLGFAASPNAAPADTIYSLVVGNTSLDNASQAPYGTVDVSLNAAGTVATVTFTAGSGGGNTYKFGATSAMDVNTNGAATASAFTSSSGSALSSGGSGNVSSFGTLSQTIDNHDGSGHAFTQGSFLLTKASGTWSSDANVLALNGTNGFLAAAHIFVFDATGNPNAIDTGFAGSNGLTVDTRSTPEFGSVTLMGLMLVGFGGMVGVKRLRKPAMA